MTEVLAPAVDRTRLRAAVEAGNIPTLLMVLLHLTGDRRWLEPPYAPDRNRGLGANDSGGLPDERRREVLDAVTDAVAAWYGGAPAAVPDPSTALLTEMFGVAMGEPVPEEYGRLAATELGAPVPRPRPRPEAGSGPSVLIVGAGVSGLTLAVALREAGVQHVVVERNTDVGGTWLTNSYPGCGVDTPSHLYSLSFFPRAWSGHFGKRDELAGYLADLADHFGLREDIRFGTEALDARYDEAAQRWTVQVRDRDGVECELGADVLVTAAGLFGIPAVPDLPGLDGFRGTVVHSTRWPADLDVTGRRVAVVGTGASAMQTVPAIVDRTASLTVFQRSPQWAAPAEGYFDPIDDDARWLFENVPLYRTWYRLRLAWTWNDRVHPSLQVDPAWEHPDRSLNAVNDGHREYFTRYIRSELAGRPDLQAKAVPTYPPYGKRMLLDNGWYRALTRPHVELVTEPVTGFTADAVRDATGILYRADVVVLCTGFQVNRFVAPLQVRGRGGADLHEVWGDDDATAYLGMTVPRFPNLFLMYGPNVNPGAGGSYMFIAECQARYIGDALRRMREHGLGAIECRPEVHDDYVAKVDAAHDRMVWSHPGMSTYYRNSAGRVVTNTPWRVIDYWDMTRTADLADFHVEPARDTEENR
ncbi:flavin-containing monooxygenase [Pseudonocardia oceani]|uniref:flavin-containing monooxygenase n=1 Tax=Pseudonocardia oceani TaxID=2792013 RepID=UPI001CF668E6|nr:NAD(P)/FAD-dependent oxidoreductase [Pseudonocardia oceani]